MCVCVLRARVSAKVFSALLQLGKFFPMLILPSIVSVFFKLASIISTELVFSTFSIFFRLSSFLVLYRK